LIESNVPCTRDCMQCTSTSRPTHIINFVCSPCAPPRVWHAMHACALVGACSPSGRMRRRWAAWPSRHRSQRLRHPSSHSHPRRQAGQLVRTRTRIGIAADNRKKAEMSPFVPLCLWAHAYADVSSPTHAHILLPACTLPPPLARPQRLAARCPAHAGTTHPPRRRRTPIATASRPTCVPRCHRRRRLLHA